jgi:hypothetical protein
MDIGWTDVGSGGYILVGCAHSNTRFLYIDKKIHFKIFSWETFDPNETKSAILDGERVLTQIFESGKTKDNPSQVWFGFIWRT